MPFSPGDQGETGDDKTVHTRIMTVSHLVFAVHMEPDENGDDFHSRVAIAAMRSHCHYEHRLSHADSNLLVLIITVCIAIIDSSRCACVNMEEYLQRLSSPNSRGSPS